MSNSKITFTNTTVTGAHNSLLVGELKISTPAPGSIEVPQVAPSVESNIILQRGDDSNFKFILNKSPVRPFAVNLLISSSSVTFKASNVCCLVSSFKERRDNTPSSIKPLLQIEFLVMDFIYLASEIYLKELFC